jgi:hypothetical protein
VPIIDIQRSVRQVGRIRLGEVKNGLPSKLNTFRLSSVQRGPIDRAADLYGGTVKPMANDRSDDQWEVVTEADSIPVVIPPTNHLDQWLELWSAAGCERRCDGREAIVIGGRPTTGSPCVCDPDNRECRATTRLWVVLPELEALGVWRLESHGYYAATELAGAADLCAAATQRGFAVPARLALESRTRRTRDVNGKPQTLRYAVPVLSVDVSIPQAQAILGQLDAGTGEITRPAPVEIAGPAPVDEIAERSLGTRSAAVAPPPAAALPPPPPPAAIPAPRTHQAFTQAQGAAEAPQPEDDQPQLPETAPGKKLTDAQRFAIDLGVDDDTRHRLYTIVTGEPDASYGLLDGKQRNQVVRLANQIRTGGTTLEQLATQAGS